MSLIGTVANYGGRQPDNFSNTKQFVTGAGSYVTWIYKTLPSGLKVQTTSDSKTPVYINSDLYVNGSIYNTSDALLKENVITLSQEKTKNILDLNPVEFCFKSDIGKTKHYGFIAQDVEKIFPELIKKNVLGYKTINYIELIPIILTKIKSMQNEIDELKEKSDDK